MGAILGTIASILAAFGLDKGFEYITEAVHKNNYSNINLTKVIESVINAARAKSNLLASKVYDRLNAIPNLYAMNPSLQGYMEKVRTDIKQKGRTAQKELSKIEANLNTLDDYVNSYKQIPNSARNLYDSQVREWKDKAIEQAQNLNKVEETLK